MKRFIVKSSIFVSAAFFLACFADIHISDYLKTSGHYLHSSWNDIHTEDLDNDLLINRNSRALLQYNPQVLDTLLGVNSYNLGFDGSAINRQILKYRTYCRLQEHRPEVLIQNIDFVTMAITRGIDQEQFFPYFICDRQMIRDFDEYENFSFADKYLPSLRYIGHPELIQSAFGLNSIYIQHACKGFIHNDSEYDGSKIAEIESIDYCHDSLALSLFDDFLSEETSAGVKVIMVYAPIYKDATRKIKDLYGMYEMYDSLARKYDIPVLDYTFASISNDSSYFYNAMHLNKKGADMFSKKLAEDVDSLIYD